MQNKFQLAVWGTGSWATICSNKLMEIPELNVVCCWDTDEASKNAYANKFNCRASASEGEFLKEKIDAVAIFTPNHLHPEHANKAFEAGWHVFVEKPMANDIAQAEEMIETMRRCGKTFFVGHNNRREERFRLIKKMLTRGDLGKIVFADMIFTSPMGLKQEIGLWRYEADKCQAVALSQIGVHAIDTLQYLLGPIVAAQGWIKSIAIDSDDVCLSRLEFKDGFSVQLINAYTVPRARSLRVMGTKGCILTEHEDSILFFDQTSNETQKITVDINDTVKEEFREFVDCCRSGIEPETGALVGYSSVAVVNAIIESASQANNSSAVQPLC